MTSETAVDEVLADVRDRVDPGPEERDTLERIVDELVDRAERAIAELPVDAETLHVGSTARSTWLSGDHDVDLFVLFPEEIDRDDLQSYGLEVGYAVLDDGREEYAEHPYVVGEYDGVDVDVVPCYAVSDASAIRSAVDRTPFHNAYVAERLTEELAADVRLAKAFCRGIGIYGSDLRTRGFGGFLLELLVLEHGGFEALLEAAGSWTPPVRFDPEDHGTTTFEDALVVIDPTDPERNVAAVVSETSLARFQHHARAFLAAPSPEHFVPTEPDPIDPEALRDHLDRRDTTLLGLTVTLPALVDDQLYPQVRTSRSSIADELDRRGFDVLRSTVAVTPVDDGDGLRSTDCDVESESGSCSSTESEHRSRPAASSRRAMFLFELSVDTLPAVERHEGPPVHVAEHAAGFCEKYADDPDVYGPFIEGDRYVVERERALVSATAVLDSADLLDLKHGVQVADSLSEEYTIYEDEQLASLLPAFERAIGRYFDPRP
jgi:tRNA nucleotidyltransferase (CCA-adding enzyme)